jgi:LacI family transcriptional regulator
VSHLPSLGRPKAIIVSNSVFAGCLIRTCEAPGVHCTGDLSILAFDQPDWADLVMPKLSVVRQPTTEIAYRAWECLIRRMEDESASIRTVQLEAEVIIGASVGPPPSGCMNIRPWLPRLSKNIPSPVDDPATLDGAFPGRVMT